MTHLFRNRLRDGFALPAALFAVVLVSAFVAGALFVATEELRTGREDGADQRALAAAEWALDRAILTWDPRRNGTQPIGRTDTIAAEYGAPNDTTVVTATRVQRRAVWLAATATRGGDGRAIPARRTVAASLRLVNVPFPTTAALTSSGAVVVDGGVVDGRAAPASGDTTECSESSSAAGIRVPDVSRVTCPSCAASSGSGVFGLPPIDSSGTNDSTFAVVVNAMIASLVRRASIDLPGGTIAPRPTSGEASCDLADPLNWGDPGGPSSCGDWLPVIHVRGAVVLGAGAVGQGILVADGSVRVEGGARFVGMVIAQGEVVVSGAGAEIAGAVFAAPASSAPVSRITDGGSIRFEPCAVQRASMTAARLVRTPERWWVELR
jgi:type II secretory pathway pseudopilin PulG